MAKKEQTMENIKDLYIEGFDIDRIAKILSKTVGTIQQYKSQDKKAGNDWDELRSKKLKRALNHTNKHKDGDLQSSFINQMKRAIDSINEDESIKPIEKTKALAQIADSYSKIIKISSNLDPEKYFMFIIKSHLDLILDLTYKTNDVHLYNGLLEILQGEEYSKNLDNVEKYYKNEALNQNFDDNLFEYKILKND